MTDEVQKGQDAPLSVEILDPHGTTVFSADLHRPGPLADEPMRSVVDRLIQQINEAGLTLSGALTHMDGHPAAEGIQLALSGLNDAIGEARVSVFTNMPPEGTTD